jgi:hypothetical protein
MWAKVRGHLEALGILMLAALVGGSALGLAAGAAVSAFHWISN